MGEPSIKLENGITLDRMHGTVLVGRMHGTVLVGKVENGQLLWIENFDNLPEKGKDLLFKMLKARKVIMSFDVQFNIVTKDIVVDDKAKPVKPEKTPKHYES
jgi:hypothetical protein